MLNVKKIIGRNQQLFDEDLQRAECTLRAALRGAKVLLVGGAGSIGRAVTLEILRREPRAVDVVDISENNLVELVREVRSTPDLYSVELRTYAIDAGGEEFRALVKSGNRYDYGLNLSALKHVRSERDPFTLMRLIQVNILNAIQIANLLGHLGARKYFCVSTDKAANPVNMMGASKRIMEMFLMGDAATLPVSTARFANVAFSDGSLLQGFTQRVAKRQPIAAPANVRRFFMTASEAGQLCLMACLLGMNRETFIPKIGPDFQPIGFPDLARRFLHGLGYEPYECESEDEARRRVDELIARGKWPVYFFMSDTTGEKECEEFTEGNEAINWNRFLNIGVIQNEASVDLQKVGYFMCQLDQMKSRGAWTKEELVELFKAIIPDFKHREMGKSLDERM